MPRQTRGTKKKTETAHEIDAILDKHISRNRNGVRHIQYLIQWTEGGPNQWLPLESLLDCETLLAEFENRNSRVKVETPERSTTLLPTLPAGSTPSISLLKWELMEKLRKANGNFNGTKKFYKALLQDMERRSEQIGQCHRWLDFTLEELRAKGFQEAAAELAGVMVDQEDVARPGCFLHTIAVPGGELQLKGLDHRGIAERNHARQDFPKHSTGQLTIQGPHRPDLSEDPGPATFEGAWDAASMNRGAAAEHAVPPDPSDPVAEWQRRRIFQQHAILSSADELSIPDVPQIDRKIDASMLPSNVFLFRWPRPRTGDILTVFCLFPNCKHNSFAEHPLHKQRAICHFREHGLVLRNESEVLSLFGFKGA